MCITGLVLRSSLILFAIGQFPSQFPCFVQFLQVFLSPAKEEQEKGISAALQWC